MAERVGFEPTVRCRTAVFKTASLNHSDISPRGHSIRRTECPFMIPVFRWIVKGEFQKDSDGALKRQFPCQMLLIYDLNPPSTLLM